MTSEAVCTSHTERAGAFRQTLCAALGGEHAIERYGSEIIRSASNYMRERRVGLRSKARAKKLRRIVDLCGDLISEVANNRDWLDANLDPIQWGGADVEEIIHDGEHSPLRALRNALAATIDEAPDQSVKEAVYFRRRLWIRLAMIFEDATERRVATSKNKDGHIQGDFVRFVVAISECIGSGEAVTSDMVDQFVDRYRSSESADLRDEIAELRMLAAAVESAG
ncbi:hypothetical protein Q8W71_07265 [Methylobacterium sp. NEAU 140]|uniref:hypothetical protein n=1 Tax=Methylobacterium sp. NEAU 140 TaxID=3064945 RepID=UPI002736858F|nr:hypothetical protein [Methylobacterium sp. NEAU 140]MDP4022416.1 hypothetical protein [Methylobacterium sp. NEAU 140]